MAKGENIFKRKDGRWEARYIKGYELSGKIKYGFCYGKTYKEAKDKVIRIKAALIVGRPIPGAGTKRQFSFYCDEWLNTSRSRVKPSTYVKYSSTLEKHIKPKLGECSVQAISNSLVNKFADELIDEGLCAKTVKDVLIVLRSIIKYTSKQVPGALSEIEILPPKETKKEMRVLSKDEESSFIEHLMSDLDECKFGVLLALLTGIRIGELCAMRWDSVSIEERTIKVSATMQRLHDYNNEGNQRTKVVVGTPKSETSARVIPMSEAAFKLCQLMPPKSGEAFILTGTDKYVEPRTLQYKLKKYTAQCGLKDVHFHTLRHTFATRCVEVGFDVKTLSEILGHSATSITLDRYVHSSMELKRDNMSKLTAAGL